MKRLLLPAALLALLLCGMPLHAWIPPAQTIDFLHSAWPMRQQDEGGNAEAISLTNQGNAYANRSEYTNAIGLYQQALAIDQQVGDKGSEAQVLNKLGSVSMSLSQYAQAIDYFQQALPIFQRSSDKDGQAAVLNNLGQAYAALSQYAQAIAFLQQALVLYRQNGDTDGEATALSNLGVDNWHLSQYAKAIDFYQQALVIRKRSGDMDGQANVLNNMGTTYDALGQYAQAIDCFQQALPVTQQLRDRDGEAVVLSNLGQACCRLREYTKDIGFTQQALAIQKQAGNENGEAIDLENLGSAYEGLNNHAQAIACYQQALPILHQIGDKNTEAETLSDIGNAYANQGQDARAIDLYQQALPILHQIGNKEWEAGNLSNFMSALESLQQPRAAIFYGKQAVNVYQSIRAGLQAQATGGHQFVDRGAQQDYLTSISGTYRTLADLLIGQGRLAEAEQVLGLLKQREYYDFLNPGAGKDDAAASQAPPGTVTYTKREAKWAEADNSGLQQAALLDFQGKPTADDLPTHMGGAQDVQRALGPGIAVVYTIVAPEKLDLILITAVGQPKVCSVTTLSQNGQTKPYTTDALYQQVYDLRRALTDRDADPRPQAGDLYRLLIAPLQKDLRAAHVRTLLFSLDDALRYVPPAALYDPDTKRYLVQDYATAEITLADTSANAPAPAAPASAHPLSVLAVGVTQGYTVHDPVTNKDLTFPELPGVGLELAAIVRQGGETRGLFPGQRLEDAAFTWPTLEADLKPGAYPVVHFASHFALHATDTDSYLLLGDGQRLSVADLRAVPDRFHGVDLLTLSACDTAMEIKSAGVAASSGREVEGFGALAQQLGARSVLASLWPVSDDVTPALMGAFYGYRKSHPQAPQPEALRWAQLSLLYGHAPGPADGFPDAAAAPPASPPPPAPSVSPRKRGTAMDDDEAPSDAPKFSAPAGAPDAHPFYWAPFLLLGKLVTHPLHP